MRNKKKLTYIYQIRIHLSLFEINAAQKQMSFRNQIEFI